MDLAYGSCRVKFQLRLLSEEMEEGRFPVKPQAYAQVCAVEASTIAPDVMMGGQKVRSSTTLDHLHPFYE